MQGRVIRLVLTVGPLDPLATIQPDETAAHVAELILDMILIELQTEAQDQHRYYTVCPYGASVVKSTLGHRWVWQTAYVSPILPYRFLSSRQLLKSRPNWRGYLKVAQSVWCVLHSLSFSDRRILYCPASKFRVRGGVHACTVAGRTC